MQAAGETEDRQTDRQTDRQAERQTGRETDRPHLVFDHGAEVVVPEEDGQLALLGRGVELTQAVIGQLGCRGFQELLRHQT